MNRDGGLGGERAQHVAGCLVERCDLAPPQVEGADHSVVEQHWCRDHAPEAAELLDVGATVFGIGEDVLDLLSRPVEADPPDECRTVQPQGVSADQVAVYLCCRTRAADQAEAVLVE